ncbi:MAG TPA: hypothetical protein VMI75_25805 [Polyangiaceae bacterium]|nr:hypothetical protein [Polyangiaceae bacterium]
MERTGSSDPLGGVPPTGVAGWVTGASGTGVAGGCGGSGAGTGARGGLGGVWAISVNH